MIRACAPAEIGDILTVINDAASAYRGVIPADRWHDPYMAATELQRELDDGVAFWGFYDAGVLVGVMGLQPVADVALIRHAYTRSSSRGSGVGSALLAHVRGRTTRPMLVGTWTAATWAVAFYRRRGFDLVPPHQTRLLLRRYWSVPERQAEESVVLGDEAWFAVDRAYTITTDRTQLDVAAIHAFLTQSYWSPGVPLATVARAIENSLCFGILHGGAQVGFARVVTDKATFAYLADVYLLEAHRGKGLAKKLMACILAHDDLQGLRRVLLATRDAHGLYRQFGFTPLAAPETMMERRRQEMR